MENQGFHEIKTPETIRITTYTASFTDHYYLVYCERSKNRPCKLHCIPAFNEESLIAQTLENL
jgi:hypothetical protein